MSQSAKNEQRVAGVTLDAEIASRVMGWTDVSEKQMWSFPEDLTDPNAQAEPDGFELRGLPPGATEGGGERAVPGYSTKIAAALLVEDEMERRGLGVEYMVALAHRIGFSGFSTLGWADLFKYVRATPLQRCRAALVVGASPAGDLAGNQP